MELSYTIDIDDKELDKKLKEITSKLQKSSTEWQDMLKPLHMPSFSPSGGATPSMPKIKPEIVGLKAELADLEKQWSRLTIAQRQSLEGQNIVKQYADLKKQAGELSGTLNQLTKAQEKAAQGGSNFNKSIKDIGTQTQKTGIFASELVNTLKTFAGFYFARDAVKQLMDISGQFELQRVSLKAILQDATAANKIFSQLQGLAVKSPFQFLELAAGAKQLAAMGTATKDLFAMTKTITDLSAGLGVDMSRLILAVGQVQASAVLRGTELRQFTEAGIPLIQLLRDKWNELNGTMIKTGDVFDLIGTRQISFEMVKDVLTDLTSEGGRFYDMQAKQAETLYGKLSNLRDAYDIMLDQIGQSTQDVLKGSLDSIITLMNNWEVLADVLKGIIVSYGLYKTAVLTQIVLEGRLAAAIKGTIAIQKISKLLMASNPYALAFAGIAALTTGIIAFINVKNREKEAIENAIKPITEEQQQVNDLIGKLKDSNISEKDRLSVLRDLSTANEDVAKQIEKEGSSLERLIQIQEEYNKQKQAERTIKRFSIEGGFEEYAEKLLKSRLDVESETEKISNAYITLFQKIEKLFAEDKLKQFQSPIMEIVNSDKSAAEKYAAIYKIWDDYNTKIDRKRGLFFGKIKQELELFDSLFGESKFGRIVPYNYIESINELTESEKRFNAESEEMKKRILDTANVMFGAGTQAAKEFIKTMNEMYGLVKPEKIPSIVVLDEYTAAYNAYISKYAPLISGEKVNVKPIELLTSKTDDLKKETEKLQLLQNVFNEQSKSWSKDAVKSKQSEIDAQKEIVRQTEISFKAAGGRAKVTKEQNDANKDAISRLKEESDLIKKVYADYEKLRKSMGDTAAQEEIKRIYSGLMQPEAIPFDAATYKKQLTDIAAKLQKLDVKAATDVKLVITDEDIKELEKRIKYALDKSSKEIERHKDQYDIYKQLIEKGFSEGRAQTLAFGVEFTVAQGGYDIGKFLADQLEQTLSVSIPGVSIDFDADTTFVDQIGTAYDGLNEDLKKQVISLEKFRSDEQKNSFLKYATLVKKETPEGMGLQFDLSNVFAKYKEELTNIQADAKMAMSSVEYKKASAPGATVEQKSEKEAVDKNVQLQIEANQKVALDKAKKLGSVYLQERMEIAGLGEIYKNMSTASSASLQKMLEVVNTAMSDLLTGTSERLEESGLGQFANYFEQAFNAENATEYAEQMALISTYLSNITPEAVQGLGFTPEMIQKAIQFAAAQRSVALNTQATSKEIKAVDSKRLIAAYQSIGDNTKDVIDSVKGLGDAFGIEFDDISKAAMDMVGTIVDSSMDVMSEIESTAKMAGEGMSLTAIMASDSISTVEKASIILTVISAALKIAMAIANLFATKAKKKNQDIIKDSEAQIKRLENAYADLGRAADKALGTDVYDKQADQIKNLGQQQKELQKQLATEGEKGGLSAEEADEIRRQIVELGQEQEDLVDGIRDGILGTAKDIASELGNAFFDAFAAGEDYAEAWGKKVDEIVGDILKKMLIQKLLEKPLGEAMDRFSNKFIDKTTGKVDVNKMLDGLDEFAEEVNGIGGTFSDAIQKAIEANPELKKYLIGEGAEDVGKGTAQAITGVTEDTANILGGIMNGMRAEMIIHTGIFSSIYTLLQQRLIVTDNPIIQLQLNVMNQQLIELQTIKSILNNTLGAAFDAASGRFKVK